MESGNSSSMQSSSGGGGGGEEEYDSRVADQSISAYFDHHVSSLHPPQQNHLNLLHFDQTNNNSLIPPNYFNNTFLPVNNQPDLISQPDLRAFSATSSHPPPNNIGGIIKKTKKRTRASRRAPTTVLTTDTSNFRAMVQEFTGIPAPPLFSNNSVVNTTSLNTFLGLSSSPNSYNNNNLLLRPFAQKLLPTSSSLLSGSQFQQYQNANNRFENVNLHALLQSQVTADPRSNDHDQFGLGMLQSQSTTTPATTVAANGNVTNGDQNNDGTWLCSSPDQRT